MEHTEIKRKFGLKSKFFMGLTAVSVIAGAAYAQGRDPAYQAARDNGAVGEQTDGYLGMVGNQSSAIEAMVSKNRALRRQVYTRTAKAQGISVERAAFFGGCKNIERTVPGEKYQAPDGSWKTRGSGAPQLDPSCP